MEVYTVAVLVAIYLDQARVRVRPSTWRELDRGLRLLTNVYGSRLPLEVQAFDVEALVQVQLGKVSAASTHKDMRSWRAFFNALLRWGMVEKNPVGGVPFPRLPRNFPSVLSVEETRRELVRAEETGPSIWGMVATALYAGLRKAELVYLRWADVGAESVLVRNSLEHQVKDFEEREIPLHVELRRILDRLPHDRLPWAFPSRQGRPWDPSNLRKHCIRAGLRGFHVLRRTFATNCLHCGIDVRTVQRWLGHADLQTTMRYLAADVGQRVDLINRLSYGVREPSLFAVGG